MGIPRNAGNYVWSRSFSGYNSGNNYYAWLVNSGNVNGNNNVPNSYRVPPAFSEVSLLHGVMERLKGQKGVSILTGMSDKKRNVRSSRPMDKEEGTWKMALQDSDVMHDVDVIYRELFEIWTKRIKSKNYTLEAFEFERDVGRQLLHQAEMLANLTWKSSGYNSFKIHHPDRIINAPLYADRIGQTWFIEKYEKPYIAPLLLPNNMACQENKGSYETLQRVKQALVSCFAKFGYGFAFLQLDMEGYYDNLNHSVILDQHSVLPPTGFQLLRNIVSGWNCPDSYSSTSDPAHLYGVPKGCLSSQWQGILYQNEMYKRILEAFGVEFLIWYMDDTLIFAKKIETCREIKRFIECYLVEHQMGIRLHPLKTNYAPINRGFNFCGWHYEIKPSGKILIHLKQEKKREMIGSLKWLQREYEGGRVSWTEVKNIMRGRMNYLKWGNTYHLRKHLCDRFVFQREGCQPCANLAQGETFLTEEEYYMLMDMTDSEVI